MIELDGPAIGFRAFHWAGGALRSIGVSTEWPVQRGPQVARCEGGLWEAGSREQHPEGSPVEGCTCVPLDTEILTRRGWLRHDEVHVGDETLGVGMSGRSEWTIIRRIIHVPPAPIYRVGNGYWEARCTGDHEWLVRRDGEIRKVKTLDLPGHGQVVRKGIMTTDEVVTTTTYEGGSGDISPREAAIIAWMLTDGNLGSQRISQSKPEGLAELHRLLYGLGCSVTTVPACPPGIHTRTVFRIPTKIWKPLWAKAAFFESPERFMLGLSRAALESFMEAVMLAEGHTSGANTIFTQNRGPMLDAFTLGIYLLGERPRVRSHDCDSSLSPQRGICRRVGITNAPIQRRRLTVEQIAVAPAWCVTTDLGSWTMRQDETIMPTGNCGIYAHSKPEMVQQGIIKAVTIGYGRIIIHPDGWRAEKSEIIGLIAPPKGCQHKLWDAQRDLCKECGCTGQSVARAAPVSYLTEMAFSSLPFALANQSPSLAALEILAEQYGARVIQGWDDGIALAQEQGAAPIPDEIYAQAAANASQLIVEGEGTFIPPLWLTTQWGEGVKSTSEGVTTWKVQIPTGTIKLTVTPKNDPFQEKLQLKREKRELHAKLWKPDSKTA